MEFGIDDYLLKPVEKATLALALDRVLKKTKNEVPSGSRDQLTMWLKAYCELTFDAQIPTPFILMLRPRSGRSQWIARESYMLRPAVPVVEFTDIYGNLCQRLTSPSGRFEIRTEPPSP